MNPALLAAINKGGGRAPSKMNNADKIKVKSKPLRAGQRNIEKPNPNVGRTIGKTAKGGLPRPPQRQPSLSNNYASSSAPSPPSNNALLKDILAAKSGMKRSSGNKKKGKVVVPSKLNKKKKIIKPSISRSSSSTTSTAAVSASASPPTPPSQHSSHNAAEIVQLKRRIEELTKQLASSRASETKLMEKIVSQQNDYNALLREHTLLKQSNETGKSSKWNLFMKKEKSVEQAPVQVQVQVEEKEAPSIPIASTKKAPPRPIAAPRKKPNLPKEDVSIVVANVKNNKAMNAMLINATDRKRMSNTKKTKITLNNNRSMSSNNGSSTSHPAWDAYLKRFGNPPASASQLQKFSSNAPGCDALNFKQAREVYFANKA